VAVLGLVGAMVAGSVLIGPPTSWSGSGAAASEVSALEHLPDSAPGRGGIDRPRPLLRVDHAVGALLTTALAAVALAGWAHLAGASLGRRPPVAIAAPPRPSRAPPWARTAR
jgi:hypothetical protein